jgi:ribosomal protein L37AE/L43A
MLEKGERCVLKRLCGKCRTEMKYLDNKWQCSKCSFTSKEGEFTPEFLVFGPN